MKKKNFIAKDLFSKKFKNIAPDLEKLIYNLDRQFLHAKILGFNHPKSGKRLFFESSLPKDLKKIYISTNNDFDSSKNNGLIGAFQAYMKLGDFFNLDQLEIRLPPKPFNDFGKAHEV